MDLKEAKRRMQGYVDQLNAGSAPDMQSAMTDWHERIDQGWVFHYNSKEFLETGIFETQFVGQGPVIVLDDGRIISGGSADGVADVLARHGIEP